MTIFNKFEVTMKINFLNGQVICSVALLYSVLTSNSYAMNELVNELEPEYLIHTYFKTDATVIDKALTQFDKAELHFFWTTGRNPEILKTEYGASLDVLVGGTSYGSKFPLYLGFLLENSPSKLMIKFVCDTMTFNSNKDWIIDLEKQYSTRFQILEFEKIAENMLINLPQTEKTLQDALKNGTQGNPAIASDVYRLIGMIYGKESNAIDEREIQNTQYTYCDIDTFCAGMSTDNKMSVMYFDIEKEELAVEIVDGVGHTNLMNALFCPLQIPKDIKTKHNFIWEEPILNLKSPFYIGRKQIEGKKGNNLIKLRVQTLSDFEQFCKTVLTQIQKNLFSKKQHTDNLNILTYFPALHDRIRKGEEDCENEFKSYLIDFLKSPIEIKDIINVTGPGLVDQLPNCFPLDQEYPDTNSMEWHRTHYLDFQYGNSGPLDRLEIERGELKQLVISEFNDYCRLISDVFYTLRFGKNHPFNLRFKQYLYDHFPYATSNFKSLIKQIYERKTSSLPETQTVELENWLNEQLLLLSNKFQPLISTQDIDLIEAPYYQRLEHTLKSLGITRPLVIDDFRF